MPVRSALQLDVGADVLESGASGAGRIVQVAVARTCAWQAQAAALGATLSADEHARVRRMRFERDRIALTTAYGVRRVVLAKALGVAPVAVPLYRDPLGRPRIEGDAVWTSLSHAEGWVAVAVDPDSSVGVDVEPVSRGASVEEVREAILHRDELETIAACDERSRARALLGLWVRKEAVLKAAGVGLRVPMRSFPVPHSGPVRIPGFDEEWQVRSVEVDASVEVALAASGGAAVSWAVIDPSRGRDADVAFA